MFKWKIVANIAAGALLVGGLGYYNFIDKPAEAGAKKGDKCPDFTAQIYEREGDTFFMGEETFTLSQQIGKVCVLNFWETWCQGCVEELPEFDEFYKNYGDRVEMVAIVGASSTVEEAAIWMTEKTWKKWDPNHDWVDFSLPFGYLSTETCVELGYKRLLPRTIIVDKSGYIVHEQDEKMSYADLQECVEALL